jgi:hypothetical protein
MDIPLQVFPATTLLTDPPMLCPCTTSLLPTGQAGRVLGEEANTN